MKSEASPIHGETQTSHSRIEDWKRFRDSSDAAVRAIDWAFVTDQSLERKRPHSPVLETKTRKVVQNDRNEKSLFGIQIDFQHPFEIELPVSVKRWCFLSSCKRPNSRR